MPFSAMRVRCIAGRLQWVSSAILITILTVILAACQHPTETLTPLPFFPTYTIGPQITATASNYATPTTSQTVLPPTSPVPPSSPTPGKLVTPEPSQYNYPTQGAAPASALRPPLYPVPWAPTLYDHFYFASPVAANVENSPLADYRYGGVFFEDIVHTGIDIPSPRGSLVTAAGPGTVIWAGYGIYRGGYDPADPYGLAVSIQHDFGFQNQMLYTIYGHLDQIDVVVGQHVETGDSLGLVGQTGMVTGPHLHFEVRLGENSFYTTRNPELWLVPSTGWGIIAGRMMDSVGQLLYNQMLVVTNPQNEENILAWSYGPSSVNSDSYYQENLVVGNIPEGRYLLRMAFAGWWFTKEIQVKPGMVSYFTFRGFDGFSIETPAAPGADFTPIPFESPIP